MRSWKQICKVAVPVTLAGVMCVGMMGTTFAEEVDDVYTDSYSEALAALNDYDTVSLGSSGATVFYVQVLLNSLGYTTPIDGYFGPVVESLVKQFQKTNGLYADGVAGPVTIKAMETVLAGGTVTPQQAQPVQQPEQQQAVVPASTANPTSLKVGDRGADVSKMQQALKGLGYSIVVDGYYGNVTANVVREFQKANGLYVDGYAGAQTLAKLFSGNAVGVGQQAAPAAQQQAAPAASTANPTSLKVGDRGDGVTKMQQALKNLGYSIDVDGYYGYETAAVVRKYQSANGLYVDGYAGPQTLAKLLPGNAAAPAQQTQPAQQQTPASTTPATLSTSSYLKRGDNNSQVKALQQKLKDLGYLNSVVDGDYGAVTENAVRLFQKEKGLYVDGEAGPQTIERLLATNDPYNPNGAASEVVQLARKKLDQVGWDLHAAFNWTASLQHTSYDAGDTITSGARSAFYNNVGDCIGKACAFTVMARELGYTCNAKWGAVLQVDGSYAAHCWCEILVNGQWYVCDPNFQWGTGRNGFMIHYGDSGTWKYRIDGNFPE